MFRKIITVVTLICSLNSQAQDSCKSWDDLKGTVKDLKKIVACSPHYTSLECQENLAYLTATSAGVVAVVGAAAGARAGRNVDLKAPKVCGLFNASYKLKLNILWSESVAYAGGCNSQVSDGAQRLKSVLAESQKIRESELGLLPMPFA